MIIPEWLFQELMVNIPRKIFISKPLKQMAGENNKLDDKNLNKELAKKINKSIKTFLRAHYKLDLILL